VVAPYCELGTDRHDALVAYIDDEGACFVLRDLKEGLASLELPEGGLMEALKRAEASDAWGDELAERAARAVQRHPSGVLLLSDLPESDVGEAAARAVVTGMSGESSSAPQSDVHTPPPHFDTAPAVPAMTEPPPPRASNLPPPPDAILATLGLSFDLLWPQPERKTVRELEASIAQGDFERGVTLAREEPRPVLTSAMLKRGAG